VPPRLPRIHFSVLIGSLLLATAQLPGAATSAPAAGSLPATTTAPFLALTHTEALGRAKAENKPLLLFFDGHWSDKAATLRSETFSDPKIISLLHTHAIALHIDVLTAPELTAKYHVISVPTLITLDATGNRRADVFSSTPSSPRERARRFTEFFATIPALRQNTRADDHAGQLKLARMLQYYGYSEESHTILRHLYLDVIGPQESTPGNKSKSVSALQVIALLSMSARRESAETRREFMQIEEARMTASPNNGIAAKKFASLAGSIGEFDWIKTFADSLPPGKARSILIAHHSSLVLQK
jgi:hypothetical protein